MELPEDLRELYALYQQEIHASTYTASTHTASTGGPRGVTLYDTKLPPIFGSERG